MELPHVPESSALRFRARLSTRWSDEDNQDVLNNAVYLTLFEEARLRYFRALGLMDQNRFTFVLAQTNVRFVAPGRGGADVVVEAGTTHVGTSSFVQSYRVREESSGEVWCEGEARCVGWDTDARAKRALSDEFKSAIEAYERGAS